MTQEKHHTGKYALKLHHTLRFGKHQGKAVEWLIENELEYVKFLLRKEIIALDQVAFDHLKEKAGRNPGYKKATPFKR